MSDETEQLLATALALPQAERELLIDGLVASLNPMDDHPFGAEWREEIERRVEASRQGNARLTPWEQVKREARESLDG